MINQDLLDQVDKKLLSNIVTKVRDGKTLSGQEQAFLESQRRETSHENLNEDSILKTSELVDLFGVSAQTISNLAKDKVIIRAGKKTGRYKAWGSIKNYIRMLQKGRNSKHGSSSTMEELRQRLIDEQGRKEAAIASLRELELKMKAESLVPQSEVSETIIKTLTPLRRLLDALPRHVSLIANPENPNIAELAVRNALDERVFAEIQKILLEYDDED